MNYFYFDEMFSFHFSQKPILDSLYYWLLETNPPLHMLLEKIWFYIFPANELFSRLLSLLFGLLAIYFVYKLTKLIFNKQTALIASLLLAITPYHIFTSVTNRGYSLLLFLAVLSYYYFWQIFIQKESSTKKRLVLTIINLSILFTHLTAVFVGTTQLLIIILNNKAKIKDYLIINLLPISLWLIWTITSFNKKIDANIFYGSWFMNLGNSIYFLGLSIQHFFSGPGNVFFSISMICLIVVTIVLTIVNQLKKRKVDKNFLYILLILFLPIISIILLKLWNIKFFLIVLPFLSISLAYCLNYLRTKKYITILLVLFIFFIYGAYHLLTTMEINDDWLKLNHVTNQLYNSNEKQILIYDSFIYRDLMNRYYHSPITTKPYFDYDQEYDEAVVRYNYIMLPAKESDLDEWFIANKINEYDRVVYLQFTRRGINFAPIFKKYNFNVTLYNPDILNQSINLTVYEK